MYQSAQPMDSPSCDSTSCINWEKGHCKIKSAEKVGDFCLDFEDAMDALRLKADAIRGTQLRTL